MEFKGLSMGQRLPFDETDGQFHLMLHLTPVSHMRHLTTHKLMGCEFRSITNVAILVLSLDFIWI